MTNQNTHKKLNKQLKSSQALQEEKYKLHAACAYVVTQLHAVKKDLGINENNEVVNEIKCILQRVTSIDELEKHLSGLRKKLSKEHSFNSKLDEFIEHLIFQVKNIDALIKVNDSDIIKGRINKNTLRKGSPSVFSRQYLDYKFNKPNVYNNPADNDHKMLATVIDRIDYAKDLSIIYVEGDANNPYGHSILKLGQYGYIQINTLCNKPQYLPDDKHFSDYLRAQGGHIMGVQPLELPRPAEAKAMFKKLAEEDWFWGMTHHNCLSFIHKIALAGGVSPYALGYENTNIHSPAKLPREFMNAAKKYQSQSIDDSHYKDYCLRLAGKFNAYFPKNSALPASDKQKAIEYYASLRCAGLGNREALSYLAVAYNLDYHSTLREEIAKGVRAIFTFPQNMVDDIRAGFGVFSTAIVGKELIRPDSNKTGFPMPKFSKGSSF